MKKVFQVICCAAGAGMIGFFANQLNTVAASGLAIGVGVLIGLVLILYAQFKYNRGLF